MNNGHSVARCCQPVDHYWREITQTAGILQTNFGDQYPRDKARQGRECGRYITQADTVCDKSRQYGTRQRVAIDDYRSAQHVPWFEHYANQITVSDLEFFRNYRLYASVTRLLAE
jgi:hypothetical protein